jgi:hypothetical protein
MARQIRRDTLQILKAAPSEALMFAPPGTSNHILWHAGHALWLQDLLCIELLTGKSELPRHWLTMFGMNCEPVANRTEWPSRGETVERLEQQVQRILQLLASATREQLDKVANPQRGPATVSDRIIHGLHDEAKHCGEMYLLLKLFRAK